MAGLPKTYAKLGFKKGWAAFKKVHNKTKKKHRQAVAKLHKSTSKNPAVTVHKKGSGMKISKEKLEALHGRIKSAVNRAKAAKNTDAGEMAIAVGTGLLAGVASSYGIGMIPVPAKLPKPAAIKSGIQTAAGFALALMVKNKHARAAGYGMALIGGMGLLREILPLPTFAGEVDEGMYGADWSPDGYLGNENDQTEWQGNEMNEPLGEPLGAELISPFG